MWSMIVSEWSILNALDTPHATATELDVVVSKVGRACLCEASSSVIKSVQIHLYSSNSVETGIPFPRPPVSENTATFAPYQLRLFYPEYQLTSHHSTVPLSCLPLQSLPSLLIIADQYALSVPQDQLAALISIFSRPY